MSTPKKHHVVPRFLLDHFKTPSGRLYAFDRRTPGRGIFQEVPPKLMVEKHYYSVIRSNGTRDAAPELALGLLESRAAPLIETIIEEARLHHRAAPISAEEWSVIVEFLYRQWMRSPDTLTSRYAARFHEIIDANIDAFERTVRPLDPDERAWLKSPATRARLTSNARASLALHRSKMALPALLQMGRFVVHIPTDKRSFIIGSRPVAKLTNPGDTTLGSPNVEVWLPLAPDVALALCGPPAVEYRAIPGMDFIRNTNEAIARQSTVIAGKSHPLVNSLSKIAMVEPTGLLSEAVKEAVQSIERRSRAYPPTQKSPPSRS